MGQRFKHYPFYIAGVKDVYPNVHSGTSKHPSTVVVDNLVFLSGMTAQDTKIGACLTDTIADQMIVSLDKARTALEEVGSSMGISSRPSSFSNT